jgi:hypothetical protein
MMSTPDQALREFEAMTKPLIAWLNENGNPHTTILITPTTAEVLEGRLCFYTDEFIQD